MTARGVSSGPLPKPADAAAAAYVAATFQEAGLLCRHCERCRDSEVVRTVKIPGAVMRERRCRRCRKTFVTTERYS